MEAMLTFPEEFLIGIPEVDDQHRAFYAQVSRLHDAMRAHDLEGAVSISGYLARYAREHFSMEERLMMEAGYPGYLKHAAHHAEFVRDLERWKARLTAQGASASVVIELSTWLTTWLREHIRKVDGEMARFLRARAAGK